MKNCILVINYNDYPTTIQFIENVKNFKCLDYIVVLDNCSTDDSFSKLKAYENDLIHVIQSEKNKGYAYAINYGAKYLMKIFGDCNIIVSNSDIIIKNEKTILDLIHSKNDEMAILAPIINEHGKLDRGWKIPSPIQDSLMNLIYLHRFLKPLFLYYNDDYYNGKNLVEVEAVTGCFFMIDSKHLEEVGFFDENTFLYYEENIIAKKLKDKDLKTYIDCNACVIHNHSVSINKSLNRLNKYVQLKKSQYYFQTVYNHANIFERFLLKLTYYMSYGIFYIAYKFVQ